LDGSVAIACAPTAVFWLSVAAAPTETMLKGVHLTRMIGGYVTVGPNAVLALAREGYG